MRHIPQSHKFFYHQNGTRSVKGGGEWTLILMTVIVSSKMVSMIRKIDVDRIV